MVIVKRKRGETFDALLRRFQRRFQQSGKQLETKRRRYHVGDTNRNKRRQSALRRVQMRDEFVYLTKTGQLKEDPQTARKAHRRPGV